MVITDVNQVVYQGDGVTTAFPFAFRIIDATDIRLLLIDADGTETDIQSDYFVDTVNNTVHYPGYAPGAEPPEADQPAPVQTGQRLVIYRELPITQEKDLGDKWPFFVIELALDKLTMILQQIYGWWGRTLKFGVGWQVDHPGFDATIPVEAGKTWRVNDEGTGFVATGDPDEAVVVANNAKDVADAAALVADGAKTTAQDAKAVADDAKDVADGAKTTAQDAKAVADAAALVADGAKTTAQDAKAVADDAKDVADGAKTTAQDAKAVADDAKDVAAGAKTTAEGIAGTAQDAKNIAQDAKAVADDAKNVADGAKTTAEGITGTAQEAKDIAQEAKAVADDVVTGWDTKANVASPAFTGTPTAPTPTAGDNSTKIATTEFVNASVETRISKSGLPVGFEAFTTNPTLQAGWLPLLGGEYSRTTYADLWAWVQTQTGYLINDTAWGILSNSQNGNVPFYSKGDGSTTFRVPALKCWVKGADGTETVGTYLEAGLPNIDTNVYIGQDGTGHPNGSGDSVAVGSNGSYPRKTKLFRASDYNKIYGSSTTVRPPALTMRYIIKY